MVVKVAHYINNNIEQRNSESLSQTHWALTQMKEWVLDTHHSVNGMFTTIGLLTGRMFKRDSKIPKSGIPTKVKQKFWNVHKVSHQPLQDVDQQLISTDNEI